MPIRFRQNLYQGVNAHLHSHLQRHGDWEVFHGEHINDLSRALQGLLPPETGYLAVPERSLQITRYDLLTGEARGSKTKPDVSIYQTAIFTRTSGTSATAVPTMTIPLTATITETEYIPAVMIYKAEDDEIYGTPVTRIELLSPANKPPGSHHQQYLAKRDDTLLSKINLVELDYLHERRSHLMILPDYLRREPKSSPYTILVSRPFPSPEEGTTEIYPFRVDDPIPTISIPLLGTDAIALDFGAVYHGTYLSNFLYGLRIVDYENLPEGFETYDAEDQARIREKMTTAAQKSGTP
jgi:Protein of unknown function (DUF4058)